MKSSYKNVSNSTKYNNVLSKMFEIHGISFDETFRYYIDTKTVNGKTYWVLRNSKTNVLQCRDGVFAIEVRENHPKTTECFVYVVECCLKLCGLIDSTWDRDEWSYVSYAEIDYKNDWATK